MNHTTCIGCDVGLADINGNPRNPAKVFGFDIPICAFCRQIASQRREDIVVAITKVLRA